MQAANGLGRATVASTKLKTMARCGSLTSQDRVSKDCEKKDQKSSCDHRQGIGAVLAAAHFLIFETFAG